jgi:acetolactate synthase-1/2/3 large subunit
MAPPPPPHPRTGALAALEQAAASGIRVIFANPGTSEMWLVGALDEIWRRQQNERAGGGRRSTAPRLCPILALHETVAAGAADGFSRVAHFSSSSSSPRPLAACLLHLGPGLANGLSALHNARRAGCRPPVLAIVGDLARWHQGAGAPLEMRPVAVAAPSSLPAIEALATAVSCAVVRAGETAPGPARAVRQAVRAAVSAAGGRGAGAVATVVLPHDVTWLPEVAEEESEEGEEEKADPAASAAEAFAERCAATLSRCAPGQACLLLGGRALLDEPLLMPSSSSSPHRSLLALCGAVAAATRATLLCEPLPARVDRGRGRPIVERLPYFPDAADAALRAFRCVVLVDCPRPVASFGYDGMKGRLLPEQEDYEEGEEEKGGGKAGGGRGPSVFELDGPNDAAVALAMRALCKRVGGDAVVPGVNCRGVFSAPTGPPPPLPFAAADEDNASSPPPPLSAASMCAVVAALQPEGCVLVDESLTSGGEHWPASSSCAPFSQLLLTGGAIGAGPPLALGAAAALRCLEEEQDETAAPRRRRVVLNLQADGSLMYSPQALWTQARERLPVVTVVCANGRYAILRLEQAKQRVPSVAAAAGAGLAKDGGSRKADDGPPSSSSSSSSSSSRPPSEALTSLDSPSLDFVALAQGMGVPAERATDAAQLASALKAALRRAEEGGGPTLIEAVLA